MRYTFCLILLLAAAQPATALINDGGFELGQCGAGSAWTCATDTACPNWILYVGPYAYEGNYVAQLGGACGEEANSNSFCQDVHLLWVCLSPFVTWKWWIHTEGEDAGVFRVRFEGDIIMETNLDLASDSGEQWEEGWFDVWEYEGTYELCFEFEAGSDPGMIFLDNIGQWVSPTAVEPISFSALKSRY